MPTFHRLALFKREYRRLTPEQQARFRVAVAKLVAALKQTPPALPGDPLVHPLAGHRGVYELRFAPDVHVRRSGPRRSAAHHLAANRDARRPTRALSAGADRQ